MTGPELAAAGEALIGILAAIAVVMLAVLLMRGLAKAGRTKRPKPARHLLYEVPGKTSAACREALGRPGEADLFAYELQAARSGGWYIHFTRHNPTAQMLDTLFLIQFEAELPARLSLTFVREAFGMREPVIGEQLLDAFFAGKLGAERVSR